MNCIIIIINVSHCAHRYYDQCIMSNVSHCAHRYYDQCIMSNVSHCAHRYYDSSYTRIPFLQSTIYQYLQFDTKLLASVLVSKYFIAASKLR